MTLALLLRWQLRKAHERETAFSFPARAVRSPERFESDPEPIQRGLDIGGRTYRPGSRCNNSPRRLALYVDSGILCAKWLFPNAGSVDSSSAGEGARRSSQVLQRRGARLPSGFNVPWVSHCKRHAARTPDPATCHAGRSKPGASEGGCCRISLHSRQTRDRP